MAEVYMGKIVSAKFGRNLGYQDAMFGMQFYFKLKGCSTGTYDCCWSPASTKPSEYAKWTEEDRDKHLARICRKLDQLLYDANVSSVEELIDKPVEVKIGFEGVESFRILTEIL